MAAWVIPAIAAAGSALGGIGSVIQGARGSGGGADIGAQHFHNLMYQMEAPHYRMKGLMKAAKEHGIHPLAMLGQQFSSPQYGYRAFDSGRDFGKMGQGLRQIAAAATGFDRKYKQLQLENMQLQNEGLRNEVRGGRLSANNPFGVVRNKNVSVTMPGQGDAGLYVDSPIPTSRAVGLQRGYAPEERTVIDQYGWVKETLSEPIQEAAESDWFFNITRTITKGLRQGWIWYAGTGPSGRQFRKLIEHVKIRKSKLMQPEPGMEYRFSILRNQFHYQRIGKRPRFFTNTTAEMAYRNIQRRSRREQERRFR